jgi:hypothetical protein
MQRSTSARIAGAAYLIYIAAAYPAMVFSSRATHGSTPAEKLATLGQNAGAAKAVILLSLVSGLCAFALAISLRAYTRDEDPDVAAFGMLCRFGEGMLSFPLALVAMLWMNGPGATSLGGPADALVAFLDKASAWQTNYGAYLFALGSTAFCYLLLRGRMIPTWLAWVGFLGSAILVIGLPSLLLGWIGSPVSDLMWAPIAVFEIVVACWFLYTGGVRRVERVS